MRRFLPALVSIMGLVLIAVMLFAASGANSARGFAPAATHATATPLTSADGCQEPPGDYTHVWVNGMQLNARTEAMLAQAQIIYLTNGGSIVNFRAAITQGSYNAGGVAASFGTHNAGGAVDLSVRSLVDWSVMEDEIEPMIHALRVAGFAAWLRDTGDLYPDSAIHIHAIAVGDAELSPIARSQIDGYFGYLRGFDGLPRTNGVPQLDRHGGPVICDWMITRGFGDMRGLPSPYPTPGGTTVPRPPLP